MQRVVGHKTIPVESVCIGMDIHVEGGWLSHPFPRSRFVVRSREQLAALRACGQRSVRVYGMEVAEPGDAASAMPVPVAAASPPALPPLPVAAAAAFAPRVQRRPPTIDGEARFAAVAAAHGAVLALAAHDPAAARGRAEAAVRGLVDDLDSPGELHIRLLASAPDAAESAHAVNVAVLSMMLARTLGLDVGEMADFGLGALLHDIGKIGLPARALAAGPQAHPADARLYESHVARGVALGSRMGLSSATTQIIGQHHEHLDGSGFPERPSGDSLSPGARIVGLADRYDKLCNPRNGAAGCTPHQALSTLFRQQQNRFDATILPAFIRMVGVYPPGSTVQLTDQRFALVTSIHASRPLKPTVIAFDGEAGLPCTPPLDLEHAGGVGVLRGVARDELPAQALAALAPPRRVAYYAAPWEPLLEAA